MTEGTYLRLGEDSPVTVWWDPKQPDRVHVTTTDPRFVDAGGGRPGLRVVFSANPGSADYNPASFNRVARALRAAGIPAPEEAPEHDRRLDRRQEVIDAFTGTEGD